MKWMWVHKCGCHGCGYNGGYSVGVICDGFYDIGIRWLDL